MRKVLMYYKSNNDRNGIIKKFKPNYKTVFIVKPITESELNHYGSYLSHENKHNLYQVPLSRDMIYNILSNLYRVGFSRLSTINNENSVEALAFNPKTHDNVYFNHSNLTFYISNDKDAKAVDNIIIKALNHTLDSDNATVRHEEVDY